MVLPKIFLVACLAAVAKAATTDPTVTIDDGGAATANSVPTFNKCCPRGQAFDLRDLKCIDQPADHFPTSIVPPFSSVVLKEKDPSYYEYQYEEDYYEYAYARIGGGAIEEDPGFRLGPDPRLPSCPESYGELEVLLHAGNDPTATDFIIDDENITGTKNALVDFNTYDKYTDFCLDKGYRSASFSGTAAVLCKPKLEQACKTKTCISHCCARGEVLNQKNQCGPPRDIDGNLLSRPEIVDEKGRKVDVRPNDIKLIFEASPTCEAQHQHDAFAVRKNGGSAVVAGADHHYTEYCVATVEAKKTEANGSRIFTYSPKLMVCAPDDPYSKGHLKWVSLMDLQVVPALFVVSMVAIAILFVHIYVKNRTKLSGVMTLCLVSMLFFFYLFVIVLKFRGGEIVSNHPRTCVAMAVLIQFCYLSAIFWLNSMSYDIWSTFRRFRFRASTPHGQTAKPGWRQRKFVFYALYSWGCPLAIVVVTLIMQHLPPEVAEADGLVLPGIGAAGNGAQRCFLAEGLPTFLYLYIVIIALLGLNALFFGLSTYNLCCGIWANKEGDVTLRRQHTTRLVTVLKMFFAMGLSWAAEVVSYLVAQAAEPNSDIKYLVAAFNIVNSLQGLILLVVIILDRSRIRSVTESLGRFSTRNSSKTTTASSQVAWNSFAQRMRTRSGDLSAIKEDVELKPVATSTTQNF